MNVLVLQSIVRYVGVKHHVSDGLAKGKIHLRKRGGPCGKKLILGKSR